MLKNKLRELIIQQQPTVGTRVITPWPGMVEVIASTNAIDYIEFVGQYAPWDLHDLENIARAAELHQVSTMFKVDQQPGTFLAQRALGSGIQNVLFTDIRSLEDAKECIRAVRPEIPGIKGFHGCHMRRNVGYLLDCGSADYVEAMKEVVIAIMVEKRECLDHLDEILSLDDIDMVQFGPGDYSLSSGHIGDWEHSEIKEAELKTIQTAIKKGKRPRVEIGPIHYRKEEIERYIELGVRDFHLPSDVVVMHQWIKENGAFLKDLLNQVKG